MILYALCVLPGVAWLVFRGNELFYYFMPIFRLPEFLIGVCVAVLHGRGFHFKSPRIVAAGGAVALFVCASFMGPRTGIFVTSNVFAVPLIALVIAALAQAPGALAWRPLGVLGHSSYAFYSMQPLVLAALIVQQRGQAHWNAWTVLGGSFLVLTSLAVLTHYLVEEPCRRLLLKPRSGRNLPAARA